MKVDCIIPTCKPNKYLDEAVKSLPKYYEINWLRLVVYENDCGNPSKARNDAVKSCDGDIIAFLDHDDICWPERFRVQRDQIIKRGADVSICAASFIDKLGFPDLFAGKIDCPNFHESTFFARSLIQSQQAGTSCIMMRRTTFTYLGGFDEGIITNGEYDLILRASRQYHISYFHKPVVCIRKHNGNLSNRKDLLRRDEAMALNKYSEDEITQALRTIIKDETNLKVKLIGIMIRRFNFQRAIELIKELDEESRAKISVLQQP